METSGIKLDICWYIHRKHWDDTARGFFEPNAPSVKSRLGSVKFLANKGIDTEIRIDPLYPSSRIDGGIRFHKPLPYYSLPEAKSQEDIFNLVRFAKESNVKAIIAKPLKVPVSNRAERCKKWFARTYADANIAKKRTVRSASWRLPDNYQKALVSTVSDLCSQEGISFKHCMHDVITRE